MRNGIGLRDEAWVGRQETVDVCPYLQGIGMQGGGNDGGGVVRTAASEVCGASRIDIGGNKTSHDGHGAALRKRFADEAVGGIEVHQSLRSLKRSLDEGARIVMACAIDERGTDE